MNDTDSPATPDTISDSLVGEVGFEELLGRARNLFHSADLDGALELLLALEKRYLAATELFDLMGDVYMRRGDAAQGIRYKTLHEVLTGALTTEREPRISEPRALAREGEPLRRAVSPPTSAEPEALEPPPATHFTMAMGHELMRQGHFESALDVFDVLSRKHPEDHALMEARETALKKTREKRLLKVLERWLQNIEQAKAGRAWRA